MNDEITNLINSINKYLLNADDHLLVENKNLIRKHTDNLNKLGDLSFPIDFNIWKHSFSLLSSNKNQQPQEDIFTYRNGNKLNDETKRDDDNQQQQLEKEESDKDKELKKLISTSITENWSLRIEKAIIQQQQQQQKNNKCFIYLDRQYAFRKCLAAHLLSPSSSTGDEGIQRLHKQIPIQIVNVNRLINKSGTFQNNTIADEEHRGEPSSSSSSLSITEYRLHIIENTLTNLINCSTKYKLLNSVNDDVEQDDDGNDEDDGNNKDNEDTNKISTILLTNKSTIKLPIENDRHNNKGKTMMKKIICGNVIDQLGNKLANITADKYINKRTTDMQLIAQHKYGLRQMNNSEFFNTIKCCGIAAVTVDLMELKHSSPVSINIDGGGGGGGNHIGSSKGAAFILYNSARIETLLNTFDKKVNIGYYPALPPEGDLDFSALKEEEEWQLMFVYIMGFSNLIERSIGNLEGIMTNKEQIQPMATHLICSFINGLVHVFSVYYRRIHILTENRPHLIVIMHSRIWLLKCVRAILNKSLALLNIQPVTQM